MEARARRGSLAALSFLWASGLLGWPATPSLAQTSGVRLNEVRTTSGADDWVELHNSTAAAVDVSGWSFRDSEDRSPYEIGAGTTLPPGGFLVLEESKMKFGLGEADSARLFDKAGALVDSYTWTSAAKTSYGRCPNGDATFRWTRTLAPTREKPNRCGEAWPGGTDVATADEQKQMGKNMSGVAYQPAKTAPSGQVTTPAVLWAVKNDPPNLYRLEWNGATWGPAPESWRNGSVLRTPTGGTPDTEGLTKAELDSPVVYISFEGEKVGVLRFDTEGKGNLLTASHEWNLSSSLPKVGANKGLEAIAWVPDTHLVERGLTFGEKAYAPKDFPNHGTGLFVVGLEDNGRLYAFALDHKNGTHTLVASFPSGLPEVMALDFDRDTGLLWAYCDNGCDNHAVILEIAADPANPKLVTFRQRQIVDPANEAIQTLNNEGITMATECGANGLKAFFWVDDDDTGGHALRQGTIRCHL